MELFFVKIVLLNTNAYFCVAQYKKKVGVLEFHVLAFLFFAASGLIAQLVRAADS
jgi:hypothetical protein